MKIYLVAFLLFAYGFSFAQQTEIVDFIKVEALIKPIHSKKMISASASYSFKILQKCDSIFQMLSILNFQILLLKIKSLFIPVEIKFGCNLSLKPIRFIPFHLLMKPFQKKQFILLQIRSEHRGRGNILQIGCLVLMI